MCGTSAGGMHKGEKGAVSYAHLTWISSPFMGVFSEACSYTLAGVNLEDSLCQRFTQLFLAILPNDLVISVSALYLLFCVGQIYQEAQLRLQGATLTRKMPLNKLSTVKEQYIFDLRAGKVK